MRGRGSAAVLVAALLGLAALLAPSARAESSPSAYGDRLVTLINQARQQHGLHALTVTSGTSTVAAAWTQHLDAQQSLSHNPDLGPQLESHGSPNWTAYGENVGEGPTSSADDVFQAYMNSPEHRDNILNAQYRYVGVGVVFDGSTAWNTLDFVDQYSTAKPRATTHSAPPPATAPKTTTTRTVTKTVTSAPRSPAAPVRHAVRRAARPHAVASAPTVQALASVAPPAAVVPAPMVPAAVTLAVPAPVHVPGRDTAPFAVAAAMILLVVASRYAAEVLPRRA